MVGFGHCGVGFRDCAAGRGCQVIDELFRESLEATFRVSIAALAKLRARHGRAWIGPWLDSVERRLSIDLEEEHTKTRERLIGRYQDLAAELVRVQASETVLAIDLNEEQAARREADTALEAVGKQLNELVEQNGKQTQQHADALARAKNEALLFWNQEFDAGQEMADKGEPEPEPFFLEGPVGPRNPRNKGYSEREMFLQTCDGYDVTVENLERQLKTAVQDCEAVAKERDALLAKVESRWSGS